MERLICLLIGYVCGLFETGYFYGKLHHIDIREHGSGNSGATNTLRTLGKKAGLIVFLGDALKCVAAAVIVYFLFRNTKSDMMPLLKMYAGAGAVLGHNYPFYLSVHIVSAKSEFCTSSSLPLCLFLLGVCSCFRQ